MYVVYPLSSLLIEHHSTENTTWFRDFIEGMSVCFNVPETVFAEIKIVTFSTLVPRSCDWCHIAAITSVDGERNSKFLALDIPPKSLSRQRGR